MSCVSSIRRGTAFDGQLSETTIEAVAKDVSTVAGKGKSTTSVGGTSLIDP